MPIAADASSPAIVHGTGTTTPLTSAAFTPPGGSFLLALVGAGWCQTPPVSMTVTDTGIHTWTNLVTATGVTTGNGGAVGIWGCYLPTAPGSIMTSVAYSGFGTSGGGTFLDILVLTGASANQANGAKNTALATTGTTAAVTLTTTTPGSLVFGITDDTSTAATFTANGSTTIDNQYNDTTDAITIVSYFASARTTTPGSVTLGGTLSASGNTNSAAFEVIPAQLPQSFVTARSALVRSYRY